MDKNSDYIFKAFIVNAEEYDNGNKETSGAWLYFPTTKEDVSALFKEIGLPNNADSNQYFIDEYKCGNTDLEKFLSMDGDIDELNYLASRISELEDIEMTVFQAVIQTKECQSIKDAINLTYNTECFDIVSDMGSWENIGVYIAERNGLGIEVVGDLSDFIDYATYGRAYANDNGGYFVDDIYLEKNSANIKEKYNGNIETIPPEYIVTENGKDISFDIQLQASMELAIQIDDYLRRHNSEYVLKYVKPDEPPVYISDCLMNRATLAIKDMLTETSTLQGDALVDKICEFEQKYPCNKYMLYQVKEGEQTRDYRYAPYNLLQKCGLSIDKNNYELTYICRLPDNATLENLFEKFNINRPQDFKGRSMSVSDIVVLHRNGEDKAYYCDVSGFIKAPEFFKENYFANAEMQVEQNYNQIDGIINNEPPKDKPPADLHLKDNNGIISFGTASTNIIVGVNSQTIQTDNQRESEEQNMSDKMKVLVIEPMKEPYTKEIDTGLKSLQKEVSGNIQAVYPFEEEAAIVCNEEGKINGLELNRALWDENGKIYDIIAGTFLVCGLSSDSFGSLPDELIDKFSKRFKQPETFIQIGQNIIPIPTKARKPSIKEQLQQTKNEQGKQPSKPPQKPEPEL